MAVEGTVESIAIDPSSVSCGIVDQQPVLINFDIATIREGNQGSNVFDKLIDVAVVPVEGA